MALSLSVIPFALILLKALSVLIALALCLLAVGWLMGADNIAFPGLGLIIAAPLLLIIIALAEILIIVAAVVLSALIR